MGTALLLVDNLFSVAQYPDHTLTAEEEASGFEVEKVQNGRRRADDHWEPTTANSASWIKVQCDRPRAANCLIFDRGHNWDGLTASVEISGDDSTYQTALSSVTVPANPAPGRPDTPDGVHTMEGAWIKTFDLDAALYWRIALGAGGAGVVPQLVGVWLGLALEVDYLDLPSSPNRSSVVVDAQVNQAGWAGSHPTGRPRGGTVDFKVQHFGALGWLRLHLEENFGQPGRPMWIVHDQDAAHLAVLGVRRGDPFGIEQTQQWVRGMVSIPWREHDPRLL